MRLRPLTTDAESPGPRPDASELFGSPAVAPFGLLEFTQFKPNVSSVSLKRGSFASGTPSGWAHPRGTVGVGLEARPMSAGKR